MDEHCFSMMGLFCLFLSCSRAVYSSGYANSVPNNTKYQRVHPQMSNVGSYVRGFCPVQSFRNQIPSIYGSAIPEASQFPTGTSASDQERRKEKNV